MRASLWWIVASLLAHDAAAQERCDNCGRVQSIRTISSRETWTPLGAMPVDPRGYDGGTQPGRVTTAYNFTSGNMVLLGAAGGAGYARRSNTYERPRWEIVVKMDSGGTRVVSNDYEPALREGDRVRVYGTQLDLVADR
jgi:outer membrane lipoprotein SlyB